MRVFRNNHPQRKYTGKPKPHYDDYRQILREDFNGRCGYTDCLDIWWGDSFHIDHFAPKKPNIKDPVKLEKFANKEHLYTNLVYACPPVNRAKGNDWPSDDPDIHSFGNRGYLDPSVTNFNDYFERTDAGGIVHKENPIAEYMWNRLKLYLKRYEIYWRVEQIIDRKRKLHDLRDKVNLPIEIKRDIETGLADLDREHMKYFEYLQVNFLELGTTR
jgi:hypothetical protein